MVVGSVFGAEFGNSLYAGLRLPEFQRELTRALKQLGGSPPFISDVVSQYESLFLKTFPALLDETGSFTSSTLASRLSKTFDLMGGAMAVDAGDASGLAALDAGMGLLRSGVADHVLCATGQSALDRASLERLWLAGRLVQREAFMQADATQRDNLMPSIPAEGVALVLLKRLEDAQAQGDKILATIHDMAATRLPNGSMVEQLQAISQTTAGLRPGLNVSNRPSMTRSMRTVGNLLGAQGLVDLIEVSLNDPADGQVSLVTQQATSGLCYCAAVQAGAPSPALLASTGHASADINLAAGFAPASTSAQAAPTSSQLSILRFAAGDRDSLKHKLNQLAQQSWPQVLSASMREFASADHWRAALVVGPTDFQAKAILLAAQLGQTNAFVPLAEQGLYWSDKTQHVGRVAWLFPGQGSQYPLMLRDWAAAEPIAQATLNECNLALASLGEPTFEQLAWSEHFTTWRERLAYTSLHVDRRLLDHALVASTRLPARHRSWP